MTTNAEKPVPSQNKVNETREDVAGVAVPEKEPETTGAHPDPYPSQADLDAIKAGANRKREANAEPAGMKYKTRQSKAD